MDMPAPLRAMGFTEALIDVAARYWADRIKIARKQRLALLHLIGLGLLSLNFAELSVQLPEGHELLTLLKWLTWLAVGVSIAFMGFLEVAIYQRNQQLKEPPLPMNQEQRSTVIKLGNSVAIGVLMFKKPPVENQFPL